VPKETAGNLRDKRSADNSVGLATRDSTIAFTMD